MLFVGFHAASNPHFEGKRMEVFNSKVRAPVACCAQAVPA